MADDGVVVDLGEPGPEQLRELLMGGISRLCANEGARDGLGDAAPFRFEPAVRPCKHRVADGLDDFVLRADDHGGLAANDLAVHDMLLSLLAYYCLLLDAGGPGPAQERPESGRGPQVLSPTEIMELVCQLRERSLKWGPNALLFWRHMISSLGVVALEGGAWRDDRAVRYCSGGWHAYVKYCDGCELCGGQ